MSIATTATREDKEKWLLRPVDWAWSLSCYAAFFGIFFYFEGVMPIEELCVLLLVAITMIAGMLLWGIRRLMNVARGRL